MKEFNFKLTPNEEEVTALSNILRMLYDSFISKGFTESQSLDLIKSIINASLNGGKRLWTLETLSAKKNLEST